MVACLEMTLEPLLYQMTLPLLDTVKLPLLFMVTLEPRPYIGAESGECVRRERDLY